MGRLDGLAVHPPGGRGGGRPGGHPDVLPQVVVECDPGAVVPPLAEPAIDGLPRREVVGQHPPGPAGPELVKDRVEDGPVVGRWPSPFGGSGFGSWDQGSEALPLGVGQVGGVGLPCHGEE